MSRPGAIPPLCGWAAAAGELDAGAWVLFVILFVWQHPHFYAIAWMCKDDYRNAGLKMLSVVNPAGTFRQTIIYSVILIGISVLPVITGMAGARDSDFFVPLDLCDTLTLTQRQDSRIELTTPLTDVADDDNLIVRAAVDTNECRDAGATHGEEIDRHGLGRTVLGCEGDRRR